jgi:exonuclease SbcC
MRPRRLRMSGFGSFRDTTELDFDGIDYFALVGPTGNGKSTVIDAIGFALYGQVPRYDDARVVHHVVSLGAQETRVELEFDVGAARYVITRVVRVRNGKPQQQGRLEQRLPDGTTESIEGAIRELPKAVERILGFGFAHFTRCVALPQGEFQRFLHDKPEARRDVLVRLLNLNLYERLGQRARSVATERKATADAHEHQLETLAGATAEREAAAKQQLDALVMLGRTVDDALPADRAYAATIEAGHAEVRRLDALCAALRAVEVPADVLELGDALGAARRDVEARADEVTAAGAARNKAEKAAAKHPDIEVLTRLADVHERLAAERAGLGSDEAALAKTARADQRAAGALDAARATVEVAEAQLEHVRLTHRAHALAVELVAGEACPVCQQVVANVPDVAPLDDLAGAERAVHDAKQAIQKAERAARTANREHAAAQQQLDARNTNIAALADAVDGHPDPDAASEALTAAKRAHAAVVAANTAERTAVEVERQARASLAAVEKQLTEVGRRYDAQRDPLIGLEPPARAADDVVDAWNGLAEWAAVRIDEQDAARQTAHEAVATAEQERVALGAAIAQQASALGVDADGLDAVKAAVVRAEATAQHQWEQVRAQREQAGAIRATVTALRADQAVATELGRLLRSDQFVDWLIVEALASLVDGASTLLHALSNGAYSLRLGDDGEFMVVDHANADETRSVRTLSGGETFQTSLALALALSDQLSSLAADGAPKLEAIFLDEGFGSLDVESLDTVASTIEALGTSGRMVGIVTHVRELAERVPVRFEVTKVGRSSHIQMVTV